MPDLFERNNKDLIVSTQKLKEYKKITLNKKRIPRKPFSKSQSRNQFSK